MKRISKFITVFLILSVALTSLFSCGNKLKGRYESESVFGTKTVYEFSGNEVKRTISGELGSKTVEGEYEIRDSEDGGKTIILDFDEDDENAGVAWSFVMEDEYIEIAGVRFKKVK